MTVLSWSVEFISGGLVLIDMLFSLSANKNWESIITPVIDVLLCSIIIPGTYLLKTENVKNIVFNKGWSESWREFCHMSTNRVVPIENIHLNPVQNIPLPPNRISGEVPISIISGSNNASCRRPWGYILYIE